VLHLSPELVVTAPHRQHLSAEQRSVSLRQRGAGWGGAGRGGAVRARARAAVAGGRLAGSGMADVEMAGGGRWMEVRDDFLFFSIFPFFHFFLLTCQCVLVHLN
jgi:hypothetical protein